MTEGGLGRGCRRKAQKILKRPIRRRGRHCLHIFDFYQKVLQSWLPLGRFVAFFCKVLMMAIYQRTSSLFFMTLTHPKTQIFPMKVMGNLTLMIWMTVSVYPSFVFVRVIFPSFVRPYIFLTTLHVNKEQYAMELKGCASHFEGLRTHVESDLIPRFGRPVPELSMISSLLVDTIYQEHNHRITQWNDTFLNQGTQNVQCL